MEHLLVGLIRYLLSLDEWRLRRLERWVPDLKQVLDNPAEALRQRDIEIGPWNRHIRNLVIVLLLGIGVGVVIIVAESPTVTAWSLLAWLVAAAIVLATGRGGTCVVGVAGVEFRRRGLAVFCPWDLFHVQGRAIYYAESYQLDLPAEPTALGRIELRQHDSVVSHGMEVRAGHVKIMPAGGIRLRLIYAVNPEELGSFLLELGSRLGQPAQPGAPDAPPPAAAREEADGWLRVQLTRLVFPPLCCDCGRTSDAWQEFHGYRSLFTVEGGEAFVKIVAPVCNECRSINRGKYWRTLLTTMVLVIVGVTVLGLLVGIILDLCGLTPGFGAMTGIMTCSGFLVSVFLSWFIANKYARSVSAPLFLSDYRPGEGTIRIWFRNPKYAELIVEMI